MSASFPGSLAARHRQISDRVVVAVAMAVTLGAWWSGPVPLVVAVVAAGVAVFWRHPVVLVVAAFLLAASLGARSWAGLARVEPSGFSGEVTLVTDPEDALGAVRVDVRAGRHRYEAWARGRAAARLRAGQAGNHVVVVGRIEPVEHAPWLAARHVAARVILTDVGSLAPGDPASQLANGVRRLLLTGAESLPPALRPLFGGFVLGDDRGERPETADDFRGAGLTHLLVVSGQNVAFVLAVASPVLIRLPWRVRWVTTLGFLVFFALLTRFEPSVLRATTMAALTTTATAWGRPISPRRVLALAVAILVLVDPLLVHSVGFRLSVAACVGMALFAAPLAGVCPGPRWLARAVGVTLSAQVGVAPVLVPLAGGLPLVAVPANLLAEPVAGLVMAWGMTAGLLAGLVPSPFSGWLHGPTTVGLWWVASVAARAAALDWGQVGLFGALVVAVAGAASVVATRRHHRGVGAAALAVAVVAAVVAARSDPALAPRLEVGTGTELSQARGPTGAVGRVLVVNGRADAGQVLAGLRRAGVRQLDLLVVTSAAPSAAAVAATIEGRLAVGALWVPTGSRVADAVTPDRGLSTQVGGLAVRVESVSPTLAVEVVDVEATGTAARDPPRDPGCSVAPCCWRWGPTVSMSPIGRS